MSRYRNIDPPGKRILAIRIVREPDNDPDLSFLGEYCHVGGDFCIDRQERGDASGRGEYRYFNPGSVAAFNVNATWIPARIKDPKKREAYWYKAMTKNVEADYKRMEDYNRGEWHATVTWAEADVILHGNTIQKLQSGGLWGIESDSGEDYFKKIESEELSSLKHILEGAGFTRKEINAAVKNLERKIL